LIEVNGWCVFDGNKATTKSSALGKKTHHPPRGFMKFNRELIIEWVGVIALGVLLSFITTWRG